MSKIIDFPRRDIRKVSVVCPFYNEENILGEAVRTFLEVMSSFAHDYELILVNDGSTDDSFEIAKKTIEGADTVTLVTYPVNQGRGHALRRGIDAASGDIIVTTEIDLSWGEDIVHNIVKKFEEAPALDCVIASPNLPEGYYENVPFRRILISKVGNLLIRTFFVPEITMNTGMTRGYRREVIQGIDFSENGKEFHLEVLLKLYSLGFRIGEVPAVLKWKKFKKKPGAKKRKSSTRMAKVMRSHLNFLFFARPLRYAWGLSLLLMAVSLTYLIAAFYQYFTVGVAFYMAAKSLLCAIVGILFFGFGILTEQNMTILKEFWRRPLPRDSRRQGSSVEGDTRGTVQE